jgi:hypothetical protein
MTTRTEMLARIIAERAELNRLRAYDVKPSPKTESSPNLAAKAPPAPSDSWRSPPAPVRADPRQRPPAHYLKGPPEPYESFIGPGGEISPTPFGTWWGPI